MVQRKTFSEKRGRVNQNFQERRKRARLSLSLPMQVQWINKEGVMFSENCKSVNVSTDGVYYESSEKLPLETDATVTFDLPFDSLANLRILRTRGRVVRIEKAETEKRGIALKFMEELKFSTPYAN